MRRINLATLLIAAISLIPTGCRQTTGPANTSPLSPIGTLSPVGQGQAPTLGPFGGPTRVTPPSTGSHMAPNSYSGGVVPIGQANTGRSPVGGLAAQPQRAIGSGVQVAGWTETNSVIPTDRNLVETPTFGTNPSATRNPRSGGMQIIDLTGSPPPPGYRPQYRPSQTQRTPSQIPAAQPRSVDVQQGWQSNSNQQQPTGNATGLRTITSPSPGEIATGLTPVSRDFPPASDYPSNPSRIDSVPRTATLPGNAPSTEPVSSSSGSDNLHWRTPGTQY